MAFGISTISRKGMFSALFAGNIETVLNMISEYHVVIRNGTECPFHNLLEDLKEYFGRKSSAGSITKDYSGKANN